MSKVVDKIVATTDQGEENYPISVLAENVIMDAATGLTLKDFYNYVKDYFANGNFMMFSEDAPQSQAVKLWYKEDSQ